MFKILGFDYSFPSRVVAAGATVEVCDTLGRPLPNSPQSVPAYTADEHDLSGVIGDLSTPLPDETLIYLVNGHRDRYQYAHSRRDALPAMLALLEAAGVDFAKF